MSCVKSPRLKVKGTKPSESKLVQSCSHRNMFRETVSSLSPPYLNSKNRIRELSIEQEIHKQIKFKKYPCLDFINYKSWLSRNQEASKESYLDGIYTKGITKLYKTSHLTALQSKLKLKFLTNSMQKLIKNDENSQQMSLRIKRNTLRKSLIADKFIITPRISKQKFSKEVESKCKEFLTDFSSKLDRLRIKKYF